MKNQVELIYNNYSLKQTLTTITGAANNMTELRPGEIVNGTWKIISRLGSGAFGVVYLCENRLKMQYAMKTESTEANHQLLKMEVHVLQLLKTVQRNRHFVQIAGKGLQRNFNYLVMTLVGKSLEDIVRV